MTKLLFGASFVCAAAAAATTYWESTRPLPPALPLEVVEKITAVRRSKEKPKQETAVVRVRNVSAQPLRIGKIMSGCTCLSAEDANGKPLQPDETRDLQVLVSLPTHGMKRVKLIIHHDGGKYPALAFVDAHGDQPFPVRYRVVNPSPTFFDRASAEAGQEVSVVYREAPGAEPALKGAQTATKDFAVVNFKSEAKDLHEFGFVERTYTFLVKFAGAAEGYHERDAALELLPSAGAAERLGHVRANLR